MKRKEDETAILIQAYENGITEYKNKIMSLLNEITDDNIVNEIKNMEPKKYEEYLDDLHTHVVLITPMPESYSIEEKESDTYYRYIGLRDVYYSLKSFYRLYDRIRKETYKLELK